jgi:signal transduction histidine kinase
MPLAELPPADLLTLNRMVLIARLFPGTAHEVNNALQIISGSADVLGPQSNGDAVQRSAQRIRAQTDRAAEALRTLMDFLHERDGDEGRFPLARILRMALTLRAYATRRAGISLTFDMGEAEQASVRGSRGELLQAVLNLLINAEQALQGRTGETITLELRASPTEVRVRVIDRGPGLPAGMAEQLFTPFASLPPGTGRPGLGLAAARLIARRHGGDITVESGDSGTCATLSVPVERSA